MIVYIYIYISIYIYVYNYIYIYIYIHIRLGCFPISCNIRFFIGLPEAAAAAIRGCPRAAVSAAVDAVPAAATASWSGAATDWSWSRTEPTGIHAASRRDSRERERQPNFIVTKPPRFAIF